MRVITKFDELGEVASAVDRAPVVGLDLETTGFDPHSCKMRLCSINTGEETYVVDVFQSGGLGLVAEALRNEKCIKVGQNMKFDQKFFMKEYDLELWPIFDTFRASNLIYNGKNLAHDLWSVYLREIGIRTTTEDLGGSDWGGVLSEEQLRYAGEDVYHLLELRDELKAKLVKYGLIRVAMIEFGSVAPEASMELNGFRLDEKKWMKLADRNKEESDKLREELLYALPSPVSQMCLPGLTGVWNLNSNDQLLASLKNLGLKIDDTQEDTLAMNTAKYPILKKIIRYKKLAKLVSTYGEKFLEHINPVTGRIHTNFYPHTGAGRYACSDPNLQNIPRSLEYRRCFCPEDGSLITVADYSQVELRLVAQISKDTGFLKVYRNREDAHAQTAAAVNDVAFSDVTKAMRQAAKSVNFGFIYGMGAKTLIVYAFSNYGVSLTMAQAKKFRKRFFDAYSGVAAWHRKIVNTVKPTGIVRTLSGRLRYLDPNKNHAEFFNTPVQGTGADGMKNSLRKVYDRLKKHGDCAKLVHMVHDETVLEHAKDDELSRFVSKELEEGMIEGMAPFLTAVPIVCEASTGPSWADKS